MEGKEADLGISSPFVAPGAGSEPYMYNDPQMRDMGAEVPEEEEEKGRPQKLALVTGPRLSGKAAVEAAATHPGGLLHGDDAYVRVETGQVLSASQRVQAARGDEVKEAQQLRAIAAKRGRARSPQVRYKGSDAVVPMTQIKAETYPLMNLASEDSNGVPAVSSANRLLAAKIKATGAGNGNYVDTTEGTVTGVAPLTQIGNAVASAGYSDKAEPVDSARSSTWAYYGAIFVVMVGSSMLLLYYMLPKGAIERAMKGDLGYENVRTPACDYSFATAFCDASIGGDASLGESKVPGAASRIAMSMFFFLGIRYQCSLHCLWLHDCIAR